MVLDSLRDLVFPSRCGGCGRDGPALCTACAGEFDRPFRHVPRPVPAGYPPTWAAADYEGRTRALLLAYKEHGRCDLGPPLGRALTNAVELALGRLREGSRKHRPVVVVPVPSRRAAARSRGGDHVRGLLAGLRPGLDPGCAIVGLLQVRGRPGDAVGQSAEDRRRSRSGVFGPVSARGRMPVDLGGIAVLLVDDLVTTGSTLVDAARALHEIRAGPVAAATLASTARWAPLTSAGTRPDRHPR